MAFNEELAQRVRKVLARKRGVRETRMMGGLCFTVRGHMCCGVLQDDLVIRVGPEAYRTALANPHARPMDFTGRPLRGFVFVRAGGCKTDRALAGWVGRAVEFISSLPPKRKKP